MHPSNLSEREILCQKSLPCVSTPADFSLVFRTLPNRLACIILLNCYKLSKRIFQIRSLPDSVKLLSRLISYPFSQKNQLFFVQFIKISEISIFRKNYVFVNRFFTISWYSVFSSVHYSVNICTIAAYRKSYIIFILKGVPSWTWKIT